MLKRENEFEKDGKIEEIKNKYNIEELFNEVVLENKVNTKEEKK